jgi:F-type H+-transporting ATPase subunit delta
MASYITQARPYAKALFEVASEKQQVETWLEVLASLAAIINNADVAQLLKNPEIPTQQLERVSSDGLSSMDEKALAALGDEWKNFLALMTSNKRLNVLPDVYALFQALHAQSAKLREVEVTSAFALSEAQQAQLAEKLAKRFGTQVRLSYSEDAELIGGLVIQSGNWVMDSSVKGKLARLNEELLS